MLKLFPSLQLFGVEALTPFFQMIKMMAAIFRAKSETGQAGRIPSTRAA